MEPLEFPVRLNRYLAHKGYSTRRGADELITKGLVKINGKVAVLGDKEINVFLIFGVFPIEKHHDIGILLDRTGISEIRKPRFSATGFYGARELGKRQNRHV